MQKCFSLTWWNLRNGRLLLSVWGPFLEGQIPAIWRMFLPVFLCCSFLVPGSSNYTEVSLWFSFADSVEDELEMATVRHRPEALELLEAQSKFTKKELQILYRGFKNVRTFFLTSPLPSSQRITKTLSVCGSRRHTVLWKPKGCVPFPSSLLDLNTVNTHWAFDWLWQANVGRT